MSYAIVEFLTKNKSVVDIIPATWFVSDEEDECFWPKLSAKVAEQLVKEKAAPQSTWPKYSIRILGKAGIKHYVIAY